MEVDSKKHRRTEAESSPFDKLIRNQMKLKSNKLAEPLFRELYLECHLNKKIYRISHIK